MRMTIRSHLVIIMIMINDNDQAFITGCSGESKRGAPPLRPKIFSISCSFWERFAKSYVGAPSYWESWIRPWDGTDKR